MGHGYNQLGGSQKSGFQKGVLGGCSPVPKTGMGGHSDVILHQKPERGHIRQNRPFTKPPHKVSWGGPVSRQETESTFDRRSQQEGKTIVILKEVRLDPSTSVFT